MYNLWYEKSPLRMPRERLILLYCTLWHENMWVRECVYVRMPLNSVFLYHTYIFCRAYILHDTNCALRWKSNGKYPLHFSFVVFSFFDFHKYFHFNVFLFFIHFQKSFVSFCARRDVVCVCFFFALFLISLWTDRIKLKWNETKRKEKVTYQGEYIVEMSKYLYVCVCWIATRKCHVKCIACTFPKDALASQTERVSRSLWIAIVSYTFCSYILRFHAGKTNRTNTQKKKIKH